MDLAARNFALVPDPIGTMLPDYPPQGGDWGSMNWSNAEFNQAIRDLAKVSDAAQGQPLREKAVSILQSELPVIPIAWYQQTAAVSKKLVNVRLDPFERDFGLARMRWAQ
jgi:peptide/nickel transport system substrate-binding protein